jgi:methionine-rich copper-binding protein CopC
MKNKKRITCFVLAVMLCLTVGGTALAATRGGITPYGSVKLRSGMPKVSTNTYKPWASVTTTLSEDLEVGFRLYKVVGNSEELITSKSVSDTDTFVKAEKEVTLSPGTYRLYAWCEGETQSDESSDTYTIR